MSNFNQYDESQVLPEYLESECYTMEDIVNALKGDWVDYITGDESASLEEIRDALDLAELDIVEWFARENMLISDEEELSQRFDRDIMPSLLAQHSTPGQAFTDQPMIDEAFNNWTDGLCRDGDIHLAQYEGYGYVGEWSEV